MPPDGYYSFVYSGEAGLGCGFFELLGGTLQGFDYAQGVYKGYVIEEGTTLRLELEATYPVGTVPISGGSPLEIPHSRKLRVPLPVDFDNGQPIRAVAPGDIILMIKRLPEESEKFAEHAATKGFRIALNP